MPKLKALKLTYFKFGLNVLFTTFLLFTLFPYQTNAQKIKQIKPAIQHATTYKVVDDISEYWLSEKLDGMRGYWNGKLLLTRQGNRIHSPKWFTKNWPTNEMDGELWIDRDKFQQTMSCVRKINTDENCWRHVRFMMFDLPKNTGTFTERIQVMTQLTRTTNSTYLAMIKQFKLDSINQLENKLNTITANKGEGLMLHHGGAYYHVGRTANIMKLKKHQDAEARVIAHLPGKGKYRGMLGALQVKTTNDIVFSIGSGFSDIERSNPPAIGSIITYKYNGKTQKGIPRFARFSRIRLYE